MLLDIVVVTLFWSVPNERVNGEPMTASDVGGYEVVVDCPDSNRQSYMVSGTSYRIEGPGLDECDFFVAVYDTDGIYSNFVKATSPTIEAPTRGGIR